jgi:hypothetical protein
MRRLPLIALWLAVAAVAYVQVRAMTLPFDAKRPGQHLKMLLHKKKPALLNVYGEKILDEALAEWRVSGPIHLALPPMYSDPTFGNAGFLSSFINHGEVLLYNEPYPHPKIAIAEKLGDGTSGASYRFDNRSTNAALLHASHGSVWPVGYTAWYDMLTMHRTVSVNTPRLIDAHGQIIEPTAVRTVHPLNHADIYGEATFARMEHLSPIVWSFPSAGSLEKSEPGYTIESVSDGAEVSYLPSLPTAHEGGIGMFVLSDGVAHTDSSAPSWWPLDERFRRLVVDGGHIDERRALLRKLFAAYPAHPFRTHYSIIAELGGSSFDEVWLRAQQSQCELPSWYLVAWTKLPWRTVRHLPCLERLGDGPLDGDGEYVAESAVFAFRAERDDKQLQSLASRVIDRSYLRTEFRGFNYPLSNFAWLWLKARP